MNLWNNNVEIEFFNESLKKFASKEKLFYNLNGEYFAYIPKDMAKQNLTLQSRNSLIGHFTETWAKNILSHIAKKFNLFALNNVVCEEIGLTKQSSADIAFCKTPDTNQKAKRQNGSKNVYRKKSKGLFYLIFNPRNHSCSNNIM